MLTEEPAKTEEQKSAEEFAKEWAGWKITPEQIERIRAQDWGACAKFYEANLERLRKLAHGYARAKREQGFGDKWNANDLLQDLYIDLPLLDWDTEQAFKSSMNKHSFFFSGHGGYSYLLQHCPKKISHKDYREEPLFIVDQRVGEDEDGEIPLDFVAAAQSVPEEMDEERERERLARMEADLPELLREILTPKQFEAWSAGRNPQTVAGRLKANADTVCAFLAAHGTAPERLRGKVESEQERKERQAVKRSRLKWEEEHLDELPPARRHSVLARISIRNARHEKRDNAKAEKTRATV